MLLDDGAVVCPGDGEVWKRRGPFEWYVQGPEGSKWVPQRSRAVPQAVFYAIMATLEAAGRTQDEKLVYEWTEAGVPALP